MASAPISITVNNDDSDQLFADAGRIQKLLFPVEIEINTTDDLLAGRTAKVMLERYKNPTAMMIPRSSVIAFAGETYVYILYDNKTVSKKIFT